MKTEAQKRAQKAYMEKRKRVPVYMTEEQYAELKAVAGGSMNAFIMEAIREKMKKEEP